MTNKTLHRRTDNTMTKRKRQTKIYKTLHRIDNTMTKRKRQTKINKTLHRKIDKGNIVPKSQKDRHGNIGHKTQKDRHG
jgi:uncharacterized protein YebE (UPF0316 family)